MANYSNEGNVPLSMAVWLASDYYDTGRRGVSATGLMKPIKQTILSRRVPVQHQIQDVMSMVASRTGVAFHDSIERAWVQNHARALKSLGLPDSVIQRVKVNPDPASLKPGDIPVYLEIRSHKEVLGIDVSGQFDFVGDGMLEDFKSTSVFTWVHGTKDEDYIKQGSIYRWLRPDLITKDKMRINFIFTDWQKASAIQQPGRYPQSRVLDKVYDLIPIKETDEWVTGRVQLLLDLVDEKEENLPPCSEDELWSTQPVYKFYKDATKANTPGARSTKNFDDYQAALSHQAQAGGVGIIKTVPGEVKACHYCQAFMVCQQKDALIRAGRLIV